MNGKSKCRSVIMVLLVSLLPTHLQALTPAGTLIFTQGKASYFDAASGTNTEAASNSVVFSVRQSAGIGIHPAAPGFSPPGQYVQFPHVISNIGNGADTFSISLITRGLLPLEALTIFDDPNRNGRVDAGEPPMTVLPEIGMGESRSIVVSALVSPTAQIGMTGTLYMTARSKFDPSKKVLIADSVEVKNDILLAASLAAVPVAPVSGDAPIEYTLTVLNIGIPTAKPVTTPVLFGSDDGIQGIPLDFDGVLLSFPIPANTRFKNAQATAPKNGLLIYKINQKWTDSFHPQRRDQVKYVGMIIPTQGGVLLPAQTAAFTVQTQVLSKVSQTVISASGVVSYANTNGETQTGTTPPVIHTLIGEPESASFTNAQGEKTRVYHSGETIYFTTIASSLNQNPAAIETVGPLVITSPISGDKESITLVESGENTGIFKGFLASAQSGSTSMTSPVWRTLPTPPEKDRNGLSKPLTKTENGILDVVQNSLLQLELIPPSREVILKDEVVIDPSGVVFNSITNEPLKGVKVTLVDPADNTLLMETGKNPVITGEDGRFTFEMPVGKEYKIKIDKESLPTGFSYPSVVPVHNLTPAGRTLDPNGSYGKLFKSSSLNFDAPTDPPDSPLFLQKSADKQSAEIGDIITYTVTIKNQSALLPVENIQLLDQPPIGVSYLRGSARCTPPGQTASQPLANPSSGYPVVFGGCGLPIQNRLGINEAMTLTYKTIVGPGALVGDGINQISATGSSTLGSTRSNTASAAVRIVPGVFTDRAILIGKVFIDRNEDGKQDEGDPGVPGVRLVLEDGTWAITDPAGKYSIYGLTPTTHVLKVDPLTLHRRFILTNSSTRFANDPRTRFIDLMPGELHKANFTIAPLPKEIWEPIIQERKARMGNGNDLPSLSPPRSTTDPVSGGIHPVASGTVQRGETPPGVGAGPYTLPEEEAEEPADDGEEISETVYFSEERLKEIVAQAEPGLAMIAPSDRAMVPIPSTNIVITGDSRYDFKLIVNDVPIPDDRVGTVVVSPERNLAAIQWIAVPLKVGKNIITVKGYDPFGNVRAQGIRTLFVPGSLAQVEIRSNPTTLPADGVSTTTLTFRLLDGNGLPILTRTFLTVMASAGKFRETDLDPDTPGLQVAIEGGETYLQLIASEQVGDAVIAAKTRGDESLGEATVSFLPPLRDMLASGILDMALNLRNLKGKIVPVDPQDRFEDGFSGEGRAALYLKGKIKGSTLLTLAYDSDKGKGERLFRDIQPDEFYPIYGDSSAKGFDAQSTGKLYVKVEQGKSYLLFGDYTPGFTEKDLLAYQRALSGVKYHFEDEQSAFTAFHNRSQQRQVVERIPANGTSGFYTLTRTPVLENSDLVEILTLNRNQPELVIKTEPKIRFVDYTLETRTGRILFKSPIPSFDENFNPIVIKVTYETLGTGVAFDTYGMDGSRKISERLQIGGTVIQSDEPGNRLTLYGAHLRSRFSEGVYVVAEVAASDSIVHGAQADGMGFKTTLSFKPNKTFDATTYGLKTNAGFQNPSANITGGKLESGLRINYIVREGTVLGGETILSTDAVTDMRRSSTDLRVEQALGSAKGEVGLKHIEDRFRLAASTKEVTTDTARLKVMTPFPKVPRLMTSVEYEWGLNRSADRMALTSDYKISEKTKLYGKKEWISGPPGLGPVGIGEGGRHTKSILGVDSAVLPGTSGFTEYRIADSISGRENQAAVGLRNRYEIQPGISLTSTFEQTEILSGAGEDHVALSGGVEHLARPDFKGSTRMEIRNATTLTSNLWTGAMAYRVKEGVSLLTRETLYREDGKRGKDDQWSSRLIVGAAVRPVSVDRVNFLSRYEFKYESSGISLSRVHVVSVEGNVSIHPKAVLFLKYANRTAQEGAGGLHIMTQMIEGRGTYDLTPKIDVGVEGRHIWSSRSQLWGYGVEGGYQVARNLWLSLGYQVNGLDQEQFTNGDAVTSGVYTRLRYKFDEGVINFLREGQLTLKGFRPAKEPPL